MNEEPLGSVGAFAERLALHLRRADDHGPALPEPEELERLVELAFFASLHEEEAKRTDFTLAWADAAGHCAAVVTLREPLLATPKNIARLAPAAGRDSTALALRRDGERLVVWALLQHVAATELPLMIRSLGAAMLQVDYRGVPEALYARGDAIFLGDTAVATSPAERLTAGFSDFAPALRAPNRIDARAAVVTRIAARALRHGRGGMLLIVPATDEPRAVRMHYEVGSGANLLALRYAALTEGVDERERLLRLAWSRPGASTAYTDTRDKAQILFDEAIDFVASLTATDNALLLDTALRIRGFGVQVLESEAPLSPFSHVNPYTGETHVDDIATFKGTRHPAGVIFCFRQVREAAAIVASQDGRLSLVLKNARQRVEVIGSYERAFGWR